MPINTDHVQNLHGQSLGRFSGNAGNFDKRERYVLELTKASSIVS